MTAAWAGRRLGPLVAAALAVLPAASAAALAIVPAASAAAWEVTPRARVAGAPSQTNARIEAIVILCRRDFVIGVVTPARRLRPDRDVAEEDALFDTVFGKAAAVVDGESFRLGVGGSGDEPTVYLFPARRDALLAALHQAEDSFAIAFDILPEGAKDGEGFETYAWFDVEGLADGLTAAGPACQRPLGAP